MNVVVADHAGTCYGVQRALDLANDQAGSTSRVQTFGPLIHNPTVVARLNEQSITVAESLDDIDADTVIIRSHGVEPSVREALESIKVDVVDATCPHVLRAQKAAYELARSGLLVVVVGEREHPEVRALCAWAVHGGGDYVVVSCLEEIPDDLPSTVGVVVQTTQHRHLLEDVLQELERRCVVAQVRDTICSATTNRQSSALELSGNVECMVVVGGRNSSNTRRLFELCSEAAPFAVLVESPDELDRSLFEGIDIVGVTAGASTPDDQIEAVVDCLRSW
ncbi:MAG: 4-hydroxy-3-methylbut-2-enyl diphosphate reductase [Eggerthellaceae bacterium]|nr:4-hydroxy-3-methylbut-2-enyl diphosphate reductase [Eggerthellaceae bacterium]